MITWIQNILQKHYKWLFSILLTVIIISFVFTIGNVPGYQGSDPVEGLTDFYGFDLTDNRTTDALAIGRNITAELDRTFLYNEDIAALAFFERAILRHLADELQIPEPDDKGRIAYIRERRAFVDSTGTYSADKYTTYMDQLRTTSQISEEDFWTIITENIRIDQAREALEGPGYVDPAEIVFQLQKSDTKWSVDVGTLNYNEFKPEIETTEEDALSYYGRNNFRYEVPEHLRISYVYFPSEGFIGQASTPTDEEITAFYKEEKSRFPGTTTVEEAREDVIKELKIINAIEFATRFAHDKFVLPLYKDKIEKGSDEFKRLIKKLRLDLIELEVTELPYAFPRHSLPGDDILKSDVLRNAFNMTHYYSEPYTVDRGVVVLIREEIIAPYIPSYEDVAGQVAADLNEERRREKFIERGKEIVEEINAAEKIKANFFHNGVTAGLEVNPYRDFRYWEAPAPENVSRVIEASLNSLKLRQVSDMIVQGETGYFIYLLEKNTPDLKPTDKEVLSQMTFLQLKRKRDALRSILGNMIAEGHKELESELSPN